MSQPIPRSSRCVKEVFLNNHAVIKETELCVEVKQLLEHSFGFGKRGLLEKGSFQKSPFSRDSREFRDSRDFRESPDSGK